MAHVNPRNTRNFIVHWVPVGSIWPHVCSIVSWMHNIWKFYQEQLYKNTLCNCHIYANKSVLLLHTSTFTFAICCRQSACRLSVCNAHAP